MAALLAVDIADPDPTYALQIFASGLKSRGRTLNAASHQFKNLVTFAPGTWTTPIDLTAIWEARFGEVLTAGEAVHVMVCYITADGIAGPRLNVAADIT